MIKFDKLKQEIDKIPEEQKASYDTLFSQEFMSKYTQFQTINEMVERSPFKVESEEDFKNMLGEEWDNYVNKKTSFQNWDEMLSQAGNEHLGKQVQQKLKKL